MKKFLLASAAALVPLIAQAAPPTFDPALLSQHVKVLSSDAFEGRGPATAGEEKTAAYIIEQFKAAGLEPGGPVGKDGKRGWVQPVPLGMFEIKGAPTLSVTAGGQAMSLTQGEEIAVRANMRNEDRVTLKDVPVVFAGYGVKAPERDWDDFKGMDVKGKVVIVLINDPDFETGPETKNGGDFGGKAMTYYGRWSYKYEEAARLGAAGLLIVHETAPASYGWATVKNSNSNTMFDIVRDKPAQTHPAMEGWIQRDLAVDLFNKAGLDFEALKKQAQTRGFQPVALKGVTLSADYGVDHKVITSKNILGVVPGAKHADEAVIYSGHWDHLGVGLPDAKGDKIYNGAVDNADGIASLIELGRAFAHQPKTDRSVVFLAVTAEEKGLLGSEYYAANPVWPAAKTVGVINIDALSAAGPAKDFSTSGDAKQDLQDMLIATGKQMGRTFTADPVPEAGHFYRSDHFPFAKRGVPAVSFGSGQDLVDGGVEAGKAFEEAYVKDRYHQPADEWSADMNFKGMAADLDLMYGLGRQLADSRTWPEWAAGSEFKAARDATKAQRK